MGAFCLGGLEEGDYSYDLTATKEGYAPANVGVDSDEMEGVRIVLRRGANPTSDDFSRAAQTLFDDVRPQNGSGPSFATACDRPAFSTWRTCIMGRASFAICPACSLPSVCS